MLSIRQHEFDSLTSYIKQQYGINLSQKKNLIEGRLSNVVLDNGFGSFAEYINFVTADKSGVQATMLINRLTTNHTFFMREAKHFEYFANNVLPYLVSKARDRDIRVWSAGCSSGEEPYTLAMIMQEYFSKQPLTWDTKVLATDISVKVLEAGEQGVYSKDVLDPLPSLWKLNYFNKIDQDLYQASDRLRNEVVFRVFNLMDQFFPFKKKFHTIFCRNVMIYFDEKTKIDLVRKFYEHTEPGGYLFIGHSESLPKEATEYKYIMPAVYRREPI